MQDDLYELLGVSRKASADEIKRAFRRQALRWHPDVNNGDPHAARHFRRIMHAYEILGDPIRRPLYDRLGLTSFERNPSGGAAPNVTAIMDEIMDAILSQRLPHTRRGEDLRYYLSISLEDVRDGIEKVIDVVRDRECGECRGTGANGPTGKKTCDTCEGLGILKPSGRLLPFRRPCPRCRGVGYQIVDKCVACEGKGRVQVTDSIKVRVPRGVDTGQRLRLRGKGNDGYHGGETGDLFVVVRVREHPVFRRKGGDLLCDLKISPERAAVGGPLEIPILGGKAAIDLPPGTPGGKLFRLRGQGLPDGPKGSPGDLHVHLIVAHGSRRRRAEAEPVLRRPAGPASGAGLFSKVRSRLQGGG